MKKVLLLIFAIYLSGSGFVYSKPLQSTEKVTSTTTSENMSEPEQDNTKDEYDDTLYEDELENNENAVYLNLSDANKQKENAVNNDIPIEKIDSLDNYEDFRLSPQNIHQYRNNDIYSKKTNSYSREKKHKNITFGAKYDNKISPNQLEQSRTLFTKYEKDNFAFGTSFKNNSLSSFDQQFRGTFSFSPEYKINNHMSFQGIHSKNFMDRSNKNEIVFTLKPFKDDRMDFNVGAGQIYYESNAPARSQFNFATKIKF